MDNPIRHYFVSLTVFTLMLALGVKHSRTGSRRCRTRAGSPISASMARPSPISTGRGRCRTSSKWS